MIVTADTHKKIALKRMKYLAMWVLIFFSILFLYAIANHIGWLKAMSEAAIVGGLADWFAVVALFRHPFGIPIPHTALIPKNKDSIGDNLGKFVSEEFLTKEHLSTELQKINIAARLAESLSSKDSSKAIASSIVEDAIPSILNAVQDEDVENFVSKQLNSKLSSIDVAKLLAKVLKMLTKDNKHQELLTQVFAKLKHEFNKSKDDIRREVEDATPFGTGMILDDKIYNGIVGSVHTKLEQAEKKNSDLRKKFDQEINNFILHVENSKEFKDQANQFIMQILTSPELQDYLDGLWGEVKAIVNKNISQDSHMIIDDLTKAIQKIAKDLGQDQKMLNKINSFVENDLVGMIVGKRVFIGNFIAKTVHSWDAKEISQKLELEVGKDLQFIRLNGTFVGGAVGLLLYFISNL